MTSKMDRKLKIKQTILEKKEEQLIFLKAQVHKHQNELSLRNKRLKSIESELTEKKYLEKRLNLQLERLGQELKTAREATIEKEKILKKIKDKPQEKQEVSQYKLKIEEINLKRKNLEIAIESTKRLRPLAEQGLAQEKFIYESLQKELKLLESQYQSEVSEVNLLSNSSKDSQDKIISAQKKILQLKRLIDKNKAQKNSLQKSINEQESLVLKNKNLEESLKNKNDDLTREIKKIEGKIKRNSPLIESLNVKIDRLQEQNNKLIRNHQTKKIRLNSIKEKVENIESKVQEYQESNDKKTRDLLNLENKKKLLEVNLENDKIKIEELSLKQKEKHELIKNLNKETLIIEKKSKDHKNEVSKRKKEIEKTSIQLKEIEVKNNKIKISHQSILEINKQLKEQEVTLKRKLNQDQLKIKKLQIEIFEYKKIEGEINKNKKDLLSLIKNQKNSLKLLEEKRETLKKPDSNNFTKLSEFINQGVKIKGDFKSKEINFNIKTKEVLKKVSKIIIKESLFLESFEITKSKNHIQIKLQGFFDDISHIKKCFRDIRDIKILNQSAIIEVNENREGKVIPI